MFIQWLTKILSAAGAATHNQVLEERTDSIVSKVEALRQQVAQDEERLKQEEEQLKQAQMRLESLTSKVESMVETKARVVKVIEENCAELGPLVKDFEAKVTLAQELKKREEQLDLILSRTTELAKLARNKE